MLHLKDLQGHALHIPVELIQTLTELGNRGLIFTRDREYEIHQDCIAEVVAAMEALEKQPRPPTMEEKIERALYAFDTQIMPRLAPILQAMVASRMQPMPAAPPKPS